MLRNLKSLFIIDEEEEKKQKKQEEILGKLDSEEDVVTSTVETTQKTAKPTTTVNFDSLNSSEANTEVKPSENFYKILFSAMEQKNIDGYDYIEFKQAVASLGKIQMDEETRYKSAYAIAQGMGAKTETLVNSVAHYINILENERIKFNQALESQIAKQVLSKKEEFAKYDELILQKKQLIKKLTDEIEQIEKEKGTNEEDIIAAEQKIKNTKREFETTFEYLKGVILADLNNIKKYL